MESTEKTGWGGIVSLILLTMIGAAGFLYYFSNQFPQSEKIIQKETPSIEKIESLEAFVNYIKFSDNTSLPKNKSNGFSYVDTKDPERNVLFFNPTEFFEKNKGRYLMLKEKALSFLTTNFITVDTVPFKERTKEMQIYSLVRNNNGLYKPIRETLEKKCSAEKCDEHEEKGLRYLYSLKGDYEKSAKLIQKMCAKDKKYCEKNVNLKLTGKVIDPNGQGIEKVKIEVLGDANYLTYTDELGDYALDFSGYDFLKVRLKASKSGFSDGVLPLEFLNKTPKGEIADLNFTLSAPIKSVEFNTQNKTFSGDGISLESDNFVILTDWSRYQIPANSLVHLNGEPYLGSVTAYLFEFNKNSDMNQFLQNDIFDDVAGYAGNIMKTFGMPYILFRSPDGEVLHVRKSSPMVLKNKISEMQALRTNADHIYEPLTDADLNFLVAKSKELGGYPIDRNFLIENKLVRFPAFWVFDQKKGVWENIGVRVLNTTGEIETIFYTINDQE